VFLENPEPTADILMAKETARIEAFSDGVFAVAITLLILAIKVPPVPGANASLAMQHARQWPSYLAFVTSFIMILIMWVNHHRMFTHIARSNDRLMFFNGMLLFGITVLPFSTALIAEYLGRPGELTAAVIYNGTLFFIATFFRLLWTRASAKGALLSDDADQRAVRQLTSSFRLGLPIHAVAFLLAFVNVTASLALNLALGFFFALPTRWSGRRALTS
jgi:uncharacterized membrane protein